MPPLPSIVSSDGMPCDGASVPGRRAAFNWLVDLEVCTKVEYEDDEWSERPPLSRKWRADRSVPLFLLEDGWMEGEPEWGDLGRQGNWAQLAKMEWGAKEQWRPREREKENVWVNVKESEGPCQCVWRWMRGKKYYYCFLTHLSSAPRGSNSCGVFLA